MAKNVHWLLNRKLNLESFFFYLFLLFSPTQLGKHFWPNFSYILGIRSDYLSPTIYFSDILFISLFICWFIRDRAYFIQFFESKKFYFYLACMLMLIILWPENKFLGLYSGIKIVEYVLVFIYLVRNCFSRYSLLDISFPLSIAFIVEAFLAIAQFIHQGSLDGLWYWLGERHFTTQTIGIANMSMNGALITRPYATLPHPNVLAGYALVLSSLFFYLWQSDIKDRKLRIVFFILLLLSSFIIFISYSRTAIVTLFIVSLIFILFGKQHRIFKISVLIAIIFFVFIPFFFLHDLSRILSLQSGDESVMQRLELLDASWALFLRSPLIGVGINNFLPQLQNISTYEINFFSLQPVHNILLLVLSETGVIGITFFIVFIYKTVVRLLRLFKITKNNIFLLCLVWVGEIILTGMSDHYWLTLQQGQILFTLIFGICWAIVKFYNRPKFNLRFNKKTRNDIIEAYGLRKISEL